MVAPESDLVCTSRIFEGVQIPAQWGLFAVTSIDPGHSLPHQFCVDQPTMNLDQADCSTVLIGIHRFNPYIFSQNHGPDGFLGLLRIGLSVLWTIYAIQADFDGCPPRTNQNGVAVENSRGRSFPGQSTRSSQKNP